MNATAAKPATPAIPNRNTGQASAKNGQRKQAVAGVVSAMCAKGKHYHCFSLSCSCKECQH